MYPWMCLFDGLQIWINYPTTFYFALLGLFFGMQIAIAILKFAVLNSLLIGILFTVNNRGNARANLYYGLLVLCLSLVVLEGVLILSGDIFSFPHVFSAGSVTLLLVPPLSYFLHLSLLDTSIRISGFKLFLHCLPFLLVTLSMLPLFTQSAEIKSEIVRSIYYEGEQIRGPYKAYSALNILQFIIYNVLIIKSIRGKYLLPLRKSIKFGLSWMSLLALILNAFVVIYIILYVTFINGSKLNFQLQLVFLYLIVATVYLTAFHLVRNPFFFQLSQGVYDRSTLRTEVINTLDKNLDGLMEEEKPHLNPQLKLGELAERLNVSTHQLSQFLNQRRQTTFNEMINSLRVEYSKKLLTSTSSTVLAVALDSGFSSQANFIRIFKKETGVTPSQFRLSHSE